VTGLTASTYSDVRFRRLGIGAIAGVLLLLAGCRPHAEETTISLQSALLPTGWSAVSLAGSIAPGSADYDAATGRFTVTSTNSQGVCRNDGTECRTGADDAELVYQPISGDRELVVRLVSLTGDASHPRAGIVLRDGLASSARMGGVFFSVGTCDSCGPPPGNEFQVTVRGENPGSGPLGVPTAVTLPVWLRVQRVGNDFAVSRSRDGLTWIPFSNISGGQFLPTSGQSAVAGFFVAAGGDNRTATAVFERATVTAPNLEWRSTWVGATTGQSSVGRPATGASSFYVAPDGTAYTYNAAAELNQNIKIIKEVDVNGTKVAKVLNAAFPSAGGVFQGGITGNGSSVFMGAAECDAWDSENHCTHNHLCVVRRKPDLNFVAGAEIKLCFTSPIVETIAGMGADQTNLFVSDYGHGRVRVLDATTLQEDTTRSFAVTRPGPIAVDGSGRVWVAQLATDYPSVGNFEIKYSATVTAYDRTTGQAIPGQQITSVVSPVGLAIGLQRLLIADNGNKQNIAYCTLSSTPPSCGDALGNVGGIFSGVPGQVDDPNAGGHARFYALVGIGVDSAGARYVASGHHGNGTDLRKFNLVGAPIWSLYGLASIGAFDIAPDETVSYYSTLHHFTFDPAKTAPGTEWSFKGITWNPFAAQAERAGRTGWPAFVRRPTDAAVPASVRGKPFMFTTSQDQVPAIDCDDPRAATTPPKYTVNMYRFEGEQAILFGAIEADYCNSPPPPPSPCPGFPTGTPLIVIWTDESNDGIRQCAELSWHSRINRVTGVDLDAAGDVWLAFDQPNALWQLKLEGASPWGGLRYSFATIDTHETVPELASGFSQIRYDRATDALYGIRSYSGLVPDTFFKVSRIDGIRGGHPAVRYDIRLPFPTGALPGYPNTSNDFMYLADPYGGKDGPGTFFNYKSLDLAGDKLFFSELWGPIHVYDANTGSPLKILSGGPEVSGAHYFEDVVYGMHAARRANGEYLITTQDGGAEARSLVFRWTPPVCNTDAGDVAGDARGITAGPDDSLWFTSASAVCRRRSTGTTSCFTPASGSTSLGGIVTGPDGNVWFTEQGYVARVDPSSGAITEFPVAAAAGAITVGPDGALWFTMRDAGAIGRITTAGVLSTYSVPVTSGAGAPTPVGVTAGWDGRIWFTEQAGRKIYALLPATGATTAMATLTAVPTGITTGADGNIWYIAAATVVGRLTSSGTISKFSFAGLGSNAVAIARGPDGNVWVTLRDSATAERKVLRVAPSGAITALTAPRSNVPLGAIATGPDSRVWFSEGTTLGYFDPLRCIPPVVVR
jgi:streptogramin lyase